MPNPELKLFIPVEAAGTDQEFEKGPGGEANLALDSADSYELKFNQNGTIRALVTKTGTQTLTNKTLTAPAINNPTLTGPAPVAFTSGTTLALTQALHANRAVFVTDVAAAYTLPLATGTGDKYTIILGATITGAATIKVANASDTFVGVAILFQDGADTVVAFAAAATDDTVDLLGTANSTGGMIGAVYEFWDVASGKWAVRITSDAGGTEATPFSATV